MGDFVDSVRNSKVPQPTQRRFSPEVWSAKFNQMAAHDDEDESVHQAGLWFFRKFEVIREALGKRDLAGMNHANRIRLLTAHLNYAYHSVHRLEDSTGKDSTMWAEEAAQGVYRGTMTGIPERPDNLVIQHVDSAPHILRHAMTAAITTNPTPKPAHGLVLRMLQETVALAIAYDTLEDLWAEVLWHGWHILNKNGVDVVTPPKTLTTLERTVSGYRHDLVQLQHTLSIVNDWTVLDTASRARLFPVYRVDIRRRGKHREHTVSRVPSAGNTPTPPVQIIFRMLADREYHDALRQRPFPLLHGISLDQLVDAWELLYALSQAYESRFPTCETVKCLGALRQFSPIVTRSLLVRLIATHVQDMSHDQADAMVRFLTFNGCSDSDIWATPLVPVDSQNYVWALAPIMVGNLLRACETWMKMGGIDLEVKGHEFEKHVRERLAYSISRSERLSNCQVHPHSLVIEADGRREEVDLALWIGHVLLLGELKCGYFPTEPLEHHHYYASLDHAADQIARKVAFAKLHAACIAKALGLNEAPTDIVPFVLTSVPLGIGFDRMGISVTDLESLRSYIEWGHVKCGVSFHIDRGMSAPAQVLEYYKTQQEAEDNIRRYLARPPLIDGYLRAVRVRTYPWPLLGENDTPMAISRAEVHYAQDGEFAVPSGIGEKMERSRQTGGR